MVLTKCTTGLMKFKAMQKAVIISVTILLLFMVQGCSTNEVSDKIVEKSHSIVYADDDSTVLSFYSNVGEKGPNIAPYFCASLENDLKNLFSQKEKNGEFKYHKNDGTAYDIYKDELKIYTSINKEMQQYGEAAIRKHLTEDLQPAFNLNNSKGKFFPFSNTYNGRKINPETIDNILSRSRKLSLRYQTMTRSGISEQKILASFDVPTQMNLFSWSGEIDTILSPNDSILYVKNLIRSSLLSIEPSTGQVKAWVGGIDFNHFPYDYVQTSRRQIGSIIKPFVVSAAMSMNVIKPCTEFSNVPYSIDPCDPRGRRWSPTGSISGNVKSNYVSSKIPIAVMSKMGACTGPQTIAAILESTGIEIPDEFITPSICLGTPDVSLLEIVSANAMIANDGVYVQPQTILRIEDRNGNIIYTSETISKKVLNPTIAFETLKMMKSVVVYGEATSLKWSQKWGGINYPTAGNTGTAQGNSDGWFIGLTPDLVTGVWAGGEDKQIRFRSMLWGQGARMALPIYGYYMQKVYANPNNKISTEDFIPSKAYDPNRFECDDDES